jgi:hypothetical protein
VERVLTVEFGPSRSKRFAKAVAEAQSGGGECSELEPGSYRVRFVLGSGGSVYTSLARLLQRVRNWRATEVYEGDQLVSSYHARDIRVSGCPKIAHRPPPREQASLRRPEDRRWPGRVAGAVGPCLSAGYLKALQLLESLEHRALDVRLVAGEPRERVDAVLGV